MKKIDKNTINLFRMSEEKEASLWAKAVIVFDSCAILDFYYIPKNTRKEIYTDIFKKLNDRLWIPSHVQYEYLKNRTKVLEKPIIQNYSPIKKIVQGLQSDVQKTVLKKITSIQQDTKNDNRHPHIDQSKLDDFKKVVDAFMSEISKFEVSILGEISDIENEIRNVENNDDVLKALERHFKTGREYNFEEILEITKEGKHRFEYQIPPGYGDLESGDKKGTQIFGDLIIWKQILEYSQQQQLPIIFITNDIKKNEDWCYVDLNSKEDRILMPREELIKEIKDHSDVDFWMYNFPQFLYHAKKHLKATISKESIQNISQLLDDRSDDNLRHLRYVHATMIVSDWLKARYADRNIIENKGFPDFTIEHSDHKEGCELKLLVSNKRGIYFLLRLLYKKGWDSIQNGVFNSFTGILIGKDEQDCSHLGEKVALFKQKNRNEFISFIIGYINEGNEFIPFSRH